MNDTIVELIAVMGDVPLQSYFVPPAEIIAGALCSSTCAQESCGGKARRDRRMYAGGATKAPAQRRRPSGLTTHRAPP